ncbi:hypothetical protein ACQJBY_018135 [Aegilops geniculata]
MAAAHAEAAASPTHRASIQATSTPPYPSAARIADSSCFPQYTASLKCLETNHQDKSKCQQQFDDYKECKKREREARLERNRSRTLFG